MDGQRQRDRHGAHLELGFVNLHHLLSGLLERLINPIENRVILDLEYEHQPRLGNLQRLAAGQWNRNRFCVVQSEHKSKLAAQRGQHFVPLEPGNTLELLGRFI